MRSIFEEIILNLSKLLDIDMHVDELGNCTLLVDDKIEVTLEYDDTSEKLLIFTPLNEIPPGKFRENVLIFSLKENNDLNFLFTLGYIESENMLAMSYTQDIDKLNNEELMDILNNFNITATFLYDSISQGTIPMIDDTSTNKPFNLK
ncbi:MAG: hypothetical protein K1060chlam5_00503 [Candidatus Anoxychlamydiales bacterium]|nr:hypothetical protein [Candidatus Anoxychlamydiales bacterium]